MEITSSCLNVGSIDNKIVGVYYMIDGGNYVYGETNRRNINKHDTEMNTGRLDQSKGLREMN